MSGVSLCYSTIEQRSDHLLYVHGANNQGVKPRSFATGGKPKGSPQTGSATTSEPGGGSLLTSATSTITSEEGSVKNVGDDNMQHHATSSRVVDSNNATGTGAGTDHRVDGDDGAQQVETSDIDSILSEDAVLSLYARGKGRSSAGAPGDRSGNSGTVLLNKEDSPPLTENALRALHPKSDSESAMSFNEALNDRGYEYDDPHDEEFDEEFSEHAGIGYSFDDEVLFIFFEHAGIGYSFDDEVLFIFSNTRG